MNAPRIHRVTALDLTLLPWVWPFAEERRADIAAHFAARQSEKPLWDGRVLLGRNARFDNGCFSADYFETGFSSFLAWRDWGFPDKDIFNGFGMGALRSADGAFALGEMAGHTANAGKVYFASGTPEPGDIEDGRVDLAGSIAREVAEETGLIPADYRAAGYWDCVVSGQLIAVIVTLDVAMSGDALRTAIMRNLSAQRAPELCDIHLVCDAADVTPAMPDFIAAFIAHALAGGGRAGDGGNCC